MKPRACLCNAADAKQEERRGRPENANRLGEEQERSRRGGERGGGGGGGGRGSKAAGEGGKSVDRRALGTPCPQKPSEEVEGEAQMRGKDEHCGMTRKEVSKPVENWITVSLRRQFHITRAQ